MDKQTKQAATFFKCERLYDSLFKQLRKKYESIGRIGGTIPIRLFSYEELEAIAGLFGKSVATLERKGTVSIVELAEALNDTRFSGVDLKALLDAYFGEELVSKKEQRLATAARITSFLERLAKSYPILTDWFAYIQTSTSEGRWILRQAEKSPDQFEQNVALLARAVTALPTHSERLPMFSQRITEDPHAFDLHTDLGKMFLYVLAVRTGDEKPVAIPKSTETINKLLQTSNIYRDDLLNFVTCANLLAVDQSGEQHPVWQATGASHTVQNVPLREIVSLSRIYPAQGKKVWIVENSGVCSTLLDYQRDIPIISTNGQFKLAALMVMDLLIKENCSLHYAGDLDPEGLQMAERLFNRYPDHVQLWHMDGKAYKKSAPSKELSQERLAKLDTIEHKTLREVADAMRLSGKAGYQEALVAHMLVDIRSS
ncbi:TIGR02679 family protein [Oceanobacillus picturae]|uniref:TIGR02679 family protein n=1 Tax=Oceanobacillus picturae TaxID=171693 RepID=UPI000E684CC2|nr:TIGR02679 family protein [Oceanobacillus picturae]RIU94445.1 TIGR02679 family protein [Oceanobacillus picturae]